MLFAYFYFAAAYLVRSDALICDSKFNVLKLVSISEEDISNLLDRVCIASK